MGDGDGTICKGVRSNGTGLALFTRCWPAVYPAVVVAAEAEEEEEEKEDQKKDPKESKQKKEKDGQKRKKTHEEDEDSEENEAQERRAQLAEEAERPRRVAAKAESTTDLLQLFLRDIGRIPLLTAKQEVELAKLIEMGDLQAKQKMVLDPGDLHRGRCDWFAWWALMVMGRWLMRRLVGITILTGSLMRFSLPV